MDTTKNRHLPDTGANIDLPAARTGRGLTRAPGLSLGLGLGLKWGMTLGLTAGITLALSACGQFGYDVVRETQSNQCQRETDPARRHDCLQRTGTSKPGDYQRYERQRQGVTGDDADERRAREQRDRDGLCIKRSNAATGAVEKLCPGS